MFDAELIREEMEVSAVLDYHDIPYRKIGNHYDIYCPDPEHHDHHLETAGCRRMEGTIVLPVRMGAVFLIFLCSNSIVLFHKRQR